LKAEASLRALLVELEAVKEEIDELVTLIRDCELDTKTRQLLLKLASHLCLTVSTMEEVLEWSRRGPRRS
jgi:hypothetical protein